MAREIVRGTQYATCILRINDDNVGLTYYVWFGVVGAVGRLREETGRRTSDCNSFLGFSLAETSFPLTTTSRFRGRTTSTSSGEAWQTELLLHTTSNATGDIAVDFTDGSIDSCIGHAVG